jgi:hypothetical protein
MGYSILYSTKVFEKSVFEQQKQSNKHVPTDETEIECGNTEF